MLNLGAIILAALGGTALFQGRKTEFAIYMVGIWVLNGLIAVRDAIRERR